MGGSGRAVFGARIPSGAGIFAHYKTGFNFGLGRNLAFGYGVGVKTILTPTENKLIEHRASALASYVWIEIVNDCDDLTQFAATAEADAEMVWQASLAGKLDIANLTPGQLAVLIDCMEGATFFADSDDACASGQVSRSTLYRWHAAADALEAKVSAAAERRVNFVRH